MCVYRERGEGLEVCVCVYGGKGAGEGGGGGGEGKHTPICHPLTQAALDLLHLGEDIAGPPIPAARLNEAVHVILSFQNGTGGWATYENTRSIAALEVCVGVWVVGWVGVRVCVLGCMLRCVVGGQICLYAST